MRARVEGGIIHAAELFGTKRYVWMDGERKSETKPISIEEITKGWENVVDAIDEFCNRREEYVTGQLEGKYVWKYGFTFDSLLEEVRGKRRNWRVITFKEQK